MRFYAQALDRDGRLWRWGRWWLLDILRCEWVWRFQIKAGARLSVGGGDSDRELHISIQTPPVDIYFGIELPVWLVERILPWHPYAYQGRTYKLTEERELQMQWHGGGLHWALWMSPNEWKSTDPKWRRGHFDPCDFFLGKRKYASHPLSEHRVLIPMPERAYPATITLREDTWKRPRWLFPLRVQRAEVTPDQGIPHQGKGENSWDCGDDATYGLTCTAGSVAEAVGKMVQCVYRDRLRYGSCSPSEDVRAR